MNNQPSWTSVESQDSPESPLHVHMSHLEQLLLEQGYARSTLRQKTRVLVDFDKWLHRRRIKLATLDVHHITMFLNHRRSCGRYCRGDPAVLRWLMVGLRGAGFVPTIETKPSPLDLIVTRFTEYLISERGLRPATVKNYLAEIRKFLLQRFQSDQVLLGKLSPDDVTGFVLRQARVVCAHRAQVVAGSLRSFLRFLYERGHIGVDLAAVVPAVANRRCLGLPKFLPPEQIESLLETCDEVTPAGRRDCGILLLLARLGLRAGEVVHMALDDIDWDAGEIAIRGKGRGEDRLPLPRDVGEALAGYLRQGRPRCSSRRVFIRLRAPNQGFAGPGAIGNVVRRALSRAGLNPAFKGAHLLRHSLATRMLRAGASLAEIGEILRHRHPSTTEIYAKVDLAALRTVAQPWPGGEV
jgi:site-specific recombinase XerD